MIALLFAFLFFSLEEGSLIMSSLSARAPGGQSWQSLLPCPGLGLELQQ